MKREVDQARQVMLTSGLHMHTKVYISTRMCTNMHRHTHTHKDIDL